MSMIFSKNSSKVLQSSNLRIQSRSWYKSYQVHKVQRYWFRQKNFHYWSSRIQSSVVFFASSWSLQVYNNLSRRPSEEISLEEAIIRRINRILPKEFYDSEGWYCNKDGEERNWDDFERKEKLHSIGFSANKGARAVNAKRRNFPRCFYYLEHASWKDSALLLVRIHFNKGKSLRLTRSSSISTSSPTEPLILLIMPWSTSSISSKSKKYTPTTTSKSIVPQPIEKKSSKISPVSSNSKSKVEGLRDLRVSYLWEVKDNKESMFVKSSAKDMDLC